MANKVKPLPGNYEKVQELKLDQPPSTFDAPLRRQEVIELVYELLRVYNGSAQFTQPVILQNQTSDPEIKVTGALAVVNGELKIWDGSAWTVVGTQT